MSSVNHKGIKPTSIPSVFVVDFEQVNVCWDVIKSLSIYYLMVHKYAMYQMFSTPIQFLLAQYFDVQTVSNKNVGDLDTRNITK